jgi:hypothetical protein
MKIIQLCFLDNIRACDDCGEMFLSPDRHRKFCASCRSLHHFAARMKYKKAFVPHYVPKPSHNTCNELYREAKYIVLEDPNGLYQGSKFSLRSIKDMVADGYFYTAIIQHEKTHRVCLAGELA